MAVNCQAAVEVGCSPAFERNQSPMVEDSASMTIEFLRARLLSERAASRTARQQAQQIAKKVSELQNRLDLEIELRKKAEAAAEKVFTVLKIKSLPTEQFVTDYCKPLQTENIGSEEEFLSPDDSKEVDSEKQLCDEICCCINEQRPEVLEFKMLARCSQISDETVLPCQSANGNLDALCYAKEEEVYYAKENKELDMGGDDKYCEVQDSVSNAFGNKEQESASEHNEMKKGTPDDAAAERQVISEKPTGMLQRIEVEVEMFSEGQPQKLKGQGRMDHIESTLEGKEPSLNFQLLDANSRMLTYSDASLPMHPRPEHNKPTSNDVHNQADVNKTLNESESFKHAEELLRLAGKVNSELNELVQKKVDGKQTFTHFMKGDHTNGSEIGVGLLDWHFTSMDKSQMPLFSEVEQYNSWRSSLPHYPFFGASQMALARHDCMGTQRSYPAELWSPRDLGDPLKSDSDKERPGYGHGYLPQTKGPVSENSTEHSHVSVTEIYPHVSVTDDLVCNTTDMNARVYGIQETHSASTTFIGHTNREFERWHPYHANTAYCQGRAPPVFSRTPEGFGCNLPAQSHTRAHVNDMARALVIDNNGSIGDILTALHLAKLQVKGEEHHPEDRLGPSTPPSGSRKPYTRYPYPGDDWRQLPYDDHPWWHEVPQAPIVQFPSSPSPDHGFSALDMNDVLIRSNSGSPVPAFEADIQPSGKVHLGNGITLYTD